jgi:hypothetical protein
MNFGFSMVRHCSPQVLDFGLKAGEKSMNARSWEFSSDNRKSALSFAEGSAIQNLY